MSCSRKHGHRSAWLVLLPLLAFAAACSGSIADPRPAQQSAATAWIAASAHPLVSTSPGASDADLSSLAAIVGTARLVGLGEATHGSHEFFTVKHRVFQYLVEHLGFTGFAIEATMPESFAVDTYVRTGKGDAAALLSHLHFWTWDTQEVLDLILWMRSYNAGRPASQQIGFYGFDMQYPEVAIDSVASYLARVSPATAQTVAADYACLAPYRNTPGGALGADYTQAGASIHTACESGIADVRTQLTANQATLERASSAGEFALALQMARVVEQWEQMKTGARLRDQSMAENVDWLLRREPAGGKLFLWAHDGHIARATPGTSFATMGAYIAQQYGASYRPIGFAFGSGSLNAVRQALGTGGAFVSTGSGVVPMVAPAPIADSYEATLASALPQSYLIDLRTAPAGDAQAWASGPAPMRQIGAVYVPEHPELFFSPHSLSAEFDALIFIPAVTATRLLR